jgi:hypothetical protein
MTFTSAPLLLRAAELLEELAEELKRSHTIAGGIWPGNDESVRQAHADHDEMLEVAKGLREKERADLAFANSLSEALNSGDGSYRP